MVKITNPLGEVKTGRQGEAVYQRRYGEQIRRTAKPKLALSSQAQLAHRQLYRDALTWRKSLSLPNRRYLDGYAIANGIIDGYGIPLPWSRLALKFYLQHVHFVIITKPTYQETEVTAKQEYYDDLAKFNTAVKVKNTWHYVQTFTPQKDFELTKVEIYCARSQSIGTTWLDLYATDEEGIPTGDPLCTDQKPYLDIPTTYTWLEWALIHPILYAQIKYAILVRTQYGSTYTYLGWKRDSVDSEYPRGEQLDYYVPGPTWIPRPDSDLGFRIYGTAKEVTTQTGLLHVRHPALMTLVHKRGELTINGYDTLSSLDDQYLVKQVGLDVEVGDTIEATTLPGIKYTHAVH